MIDKKIIETLKELNIPVLQEIKRKSDRYILFRVYNNKDTEFADDKNLRERYFITLKYYCLNSDDEDLYYSIKNLMKDNNFAFEDGGGLPQEGDYFVQELDFSIEIQR